MKYLPPEGPVNQNVDMRVSDLPPGTDIKIFWYDSQILFYPLLQCVVDALTIREKSLDMDASTNYRRTPRAHYRELFIREVRGGKTIGVTFQGFLYTILESLGDTKTFDLVDCRTARSSDRGRYPKPRLDLMYGFRFSQEALLTEALLMDQSGLIGAPTRWGKCNTENTRILMYDYSIKKAKEIVVGDLLMGPDGLPRKVVALGRGREQSYRVIPNKGEPFECNESHILSLKVTGGAKMGGWKKGDIVNIRIKDYLGRSKTFKHITKLWWAPIEFPEANLPGSPWIEGLWIGDGTNENRIPVAYLTASRKQRLELLAGLIEANGYNKNDQCYKIITKYEELSEDIVRLCRGLGFRCTRKHSQKWRIQISGYLEEIPIRSSRKITAASHRVDPMTSGFTLEDIGEQDYYGFELEGPDKLFMLWDHLVTHNTTLIVNTVRAFPDSNVCVVAPGVDLVRQLYKDFNGERGIKDREIKLICTGSKTKYMSYEHNGITICSADSLDKIDEGQVDLLLADEPHALVTHSRLSKLDKFTKARRIGYGATLHGRFDGRDNLITGIFGPVLIERTYKEAVAEKAICPLHIIFFEVEITPKTYGDRDASYNRLLFQNERMAKLTADLCSQVIPEDFQTMIFIKHEKQAELYLEHIGKEHTIAMAKRMSSSEREEVDKLMKENKIKRCLCTKIYVQGVTFSDVRVLINAEAGGNNTSAIQKPGRLAEIRPNKKCGIVFDFMFLPGGPTDGWTSDGWLALCRDSKSRKEAYEEKGYDIHYVRTIEEAKQLFDSLV